MNKIPNRQAICEVLMEKAKEDKDIVVLCSDSRGSASLKPFSEAYPEQFVEVGIAEQNLVSISAGLARCGKKPFAASPACFLSIRSYEQAKVDCAYSDTNVTLIGISGGISYGALGMSHHSAQDIAAMSAIPNMRVYLPSDRFQTAKLIKALGNHRLRGDGKTGERCGTYLKGAGNRSHGSGYVLREAAGQRSSHKCGEKGESGDYSRRARALWRTWFYGQPGNIR